jgi:transposase
LAVGRKNWLFIGGDASLPLASVMMSLCASAKRHSLSPWVYLTEVLAKMSGKPTDLTPLLPDIWGKRTR